MIKPSPPAPYFNRSNKIRAFVLGCDPTAFDKEGKPIEFMTVFGLDKDNRYFSAIEPNLNELGLSKHCVYIQNLIPDFLDFETSKNKNWEIVAKLHIQDRLLEFDHFDPDRRLPVFLTSEIIYKVLLNDGEIRKRAKELYKSEYEIIIPGNKNKLFRKLIPLYRHPAYSLKKQLRYKDLILKLKPFDVPTP
ncbi:MAG: hypothetical protein NTU44_13075 [Bacteroidetes bacterium]|nr:hypothetical protein [Bacteroidota bacterium]